MGVHGPSGQACPSWGVVHDMNSHQGLVSAVFVRYPLVEPSCLRLPRLGLVRVPVVFLVAHAFMVQPAD